MYLIYLKGAKAQGMDDTLLRLLINKQTQMSTVSSVLSEGAGGE